jgi:DNA-directed RNA polymerase subunit K/omega
MAPPKKNKKPELVEEPDIEEPELYSDEEPFYATDDDDIEYDSEGNSLYGGSVGDDDLGDDENTMEDDVDDDIDVDEEGVEDDGIYDQINEAEENEDQDEELGEEDEYDYSEGEDTEAGDLGEELEEGEIEGEIEGDAGDLEENAGAAEPGAKVCHYKNLNDDFIVISEDDSKTYGSLKAKKIPDNERISGFVMTFYEMTSVLGIREQQLKHRAPPLVQGVEGMHPAHIAYIELLMRATPHIIKRRMPNKEYEEFKISELRIIHVIDEPYYNPGGITMEKLIRQAKRPLATEEVRNLDYKNIS